MTLQSIRSVSALSLLALVAGPVHAVTVSPGFALRRIPTPGVVQGGVHRVGNAILVGQGSFGAGAQSIVRLDGATATTIADGFNSLGGFDVDAAGTLFVTDNCYTADFGCNSAVTGDTLYAIAHAAERTSPVTAASVTVLPSGSIPFAQDVLVVPGAVLVSDGTGPGAGRVLSVASGVATPLVTGLDYTAGLARSGATLFVGNSNFPSPASVRQYSLAGASLGALATGLSGAYGVAVDAGGSVLVTGGLAADFSGTLVAIAAGGAVTERAKGFAFSSDVSYDAARDAALVLDFGVQEIAAICTDADADGVCDADCAAPVAFDTLKLTFGGVGTPAGDDSLALSGELTVPSLVAPALDPLANGMRVWADDANGVVVADVVLPGGAYDPVTRIGWQVNTTGTAWKFKHPTGVVGITRASVKTVASRPGLVRFRAKGKRAGYHTAGALQPLALGVAFSPSQCGHVERTCTPVGKKLVCR